MVWYTKGMVQLNALDTPMQIGREILLTESQWQVICFFWEELLSVGGAAISWNSSKQTCVALYTAEVEYVSQSAAAQEAVWLQQLTSDLLNRSIQETVIFEDNQSAIYLAKNQQTHDWTKHIDIKYHFIRELVETGRIKLAYCPSADMVADILTKGLPAQQFEKLHGWLASKLFLPRVRRSGEGLNIVHSLLELNR